MTAAKKMPPQHISPALKSTELSTAAANSPPTRSAPRGAVPRSPFPLPFPNAAPRHARTVNTVTSPWRGALLPPRRGIPVPFICGGFFFPARLQMTSRGPPGTPTRRTFPRRTASEQRRRPSRGTPGDPAAATAAVTGGLGAGGAERPEPRGGEPSGSAALRPRPSQPQRPPGRRGADRGLSAGGSPGRGGAGGAAGPRATCCSASAGTRPGAPRTGREPRPRSPRRESAAAAPPRPRGPARRARRPAPPGARAAPAARRPRRASSLRRRRRAPLTARARCGHLLTEPAGAGRGGAGRPRCRDRDAASRRRRSRTRHVMFGSRGSIHEAPGATAPRLKGDARFCRRRRGGEGGAAP